MTLRVEDLFNGGGGGGIASIQRGSITIASGTLTNTATIAAVDAEKSAVLYAGQAYAGTTSVSAFTSAGFARLDLTDATTVTATRLGTTGDLVINYVVVEFA